MNGAPTLKQLVIESLPPGFANALFSRIANTYPESHASIFNDPNLGEHQANYVLGYYRRGLAETVLMHTAVEHGLSVRLVQPDNGGCKHIYVSVGRFGFTMCHVPTSGGFPQHSDTREQSSKINELISQGNLFPLDPGPSGEDIYGIFVHTERPGVKDTFQSLCIGFPNPEFDDWVEEPINLQDIIDIQRRLFQDQDDPHAQIQKPDPKWKTGGTSEMDGKDSS